jgi:hypothetical protein
MWSQLRAKRARPELGKLVGAHNVIAYGPKGNGMMIAVHLMLDQTGIMPLDHEWSFVDCRLNTDNKNTLGILTRRNVRCVEILMRDFGTNERYIVKNIIQTISESFVISETGLDVKLIVIHNIEHFSDESQKILAVFAEKHSSCTRYFFTTHKYNSVYRGLLTQCAGYRIPRPEESELVEAFGVSQDRHLENSIDRAQLRSLGVHKSSADQCFDEIMAKIHKIKTVRDIVYTLLVNNVSGNTIITALTDRCVRTHPDIAHEVVHWAAEYDHRLSKCERPMYHIEAFFVRLSFLISNKKNDDASALTNESSGRS